MSDGCGNRTETRQRNEVIIRSFISASLRCSGEITILIGRRIKYIAKKLRPGRGAERNRLNKFRLRPLAESNLYHMFFWAENIAGPLARNSGENYKP